MPNVAMIGGTLDLDGNALAIGTISDVFVPGTVDLGSGGTLTLTDGSTTFSGEIGGSGTVIKQGTSTFTLGGAASFTGLAAIQEGTLRLGSSGGRLSDTLAVDVAAGAVFDLNGQTDTIGSLSGDGDVTLGTGVLTVGGNDVSTAFAGTISGDGGFAKIGAGTLTLTGANAYSGATTVRQGMLAIDGGSIMQAAGITFVGRLAGDDGTLLVGNGGALTDETGIVGAYAGSTGEAIVRGTDLLGNASTWTHSSRLVVGGEGNGSLTISDGGSVSNTGGYIGYSPGSEGYVAVTGPGTAWINTGGRFGEALEIGDAGRGILRIENGGSVSSELTYMGHYAGASGTATVTGADSTWNSSDLYVGIEGDAALTISDSATVSVADSLILATAAGSSGTLNIGDGGAAGILNAAEINGGGGTATLNFNHNDADYHFTNDGTSSAETIAITGSTAVNHVGTGTTALTGDHTVTGPTTVSAGTLRVNGSVVSDTAVNAGGRLGGSGSIFGAVTVADGGVLAPGNSPGTLTVDSLTLNRGAVLDYELGRAGVVGSGVNDLIEVAGDLTLDGMLDVTDVGGFGVVVYRLINYGGALTNNGLTLGGLPTGVDASDLFVQTAIDGQVNLISSAGATLSFWDGGNAAAHDDGAVEGGDGVWEAAGRNWSLGDGAVNGPWKGDFAIFGGNAGTVTIVKAGGGLLQLTGDNSAFAGHTSLTDGALIVGVDSAGALGGTVEVLDGGLLGGSGTVGTTVVADGGTVSPGNSPGTLNVAGDITFAAGSSYAVEVDPDAGEHDLIHATGQALLDGASVAHLGLDGAYRPSETYTILTADGGVTGAFGDVSSDYAFLSAALSYDPTNVFLTLTRNDVGFADLAATRNQKAAAEGAESLGPGSAVYDAVVSLAEDEETIRAAFDALSGEIHASVKAGLIEDSRFIRDAVTDRIRTAFGDVAASPAATVLAYGPGGPEAVPANTDRFATWGRAFGASGQIDGDGNAAELHRTAGGFFLGADVLIADDWRLGLAAGYGRSSFDVKDRASSADVDNYTLAAYGGAELGALGLRFGAAHTWHKIDTSRTIAFPGFADTAKASYDGRTAQVFGEAGYSIRHGRASFEPFANLAYVDLHTDGFGESDAAGLAGHNGSADAAFTTLGVRAAGTFELGGIKATARGTLGWRHAFGDTTPLTDLAFTGGDAFTVAGTPIAEDALVLEAGLEVGISEQASLGLSYSGQIGGGARDHGLRADLSVKF